MKRLKYVFLLFPIILTLSCAQKQMEVKLPISAKEILRTSTSWDGDPIVYPEGAPEIRAIIIELQEGISTGFHCHPVPNLAYMLEGEIEVEVFEGPKKKFKKGDAFEEVIHTWHSGRVLRGPAKILVFYVGEVDTPITVKPKSNDLLNEKCLK